MKGNLFNSSSRYSSRGVSSSKEEVHNAIKKLDPGIFPKAFCKITPDFMTGNSDLCNVIHADGSGTKSILAYLHYRETGDPTVFRGIAQDSLVMNLDDLICVGATRNILISSTINRNARNIPGEVLSEIIQGTEDVLGQLRNSDISIYSGGGETADVGDLTPTILVDTCAVTVLERKKVIGAKGIGPDLSIIGLSSAGMASYESFENSGIGSNGLTSARHDMLASHYRERYPETCDAKTPKNVLYSGPYNLNSPLPHFASSVFRRPVSKWSALEQLADTLKPRQRKESFTVGEALLSPTRTYAPIINQLLKLVSEGIHGIVHCSGGGQTKCLRFGNNVHFIKDNLLPIPDVFQAIQAVSKTDWREMFVVYNMGHRLELYCNPTYTKPIIEFIRSFDVESQEIGRTEASTHNHLTIHHDGVPYTYSML